VRLDPVDRAQHSVFRIDQEAHLMKKRQEPAETTIIRSIESDRTRAAAFSHN
jgi:hypothetical protein